MTTIPANGLIPPEPHLTWVYSPATTCFLYWILPPEVVLSNFCRTQGDSTGMSSMGLLPPYTPPLSTKIVPAQAPKSSELDVINLLVSSKKISLTSHLVTNTVTEGITKELQKLPPERYHFESNPA